MGLWQIFALASVLGKPIFSAYPRLGYPVNHLSLQVDEGAQVIPVPGAIVNSVQSPGEDKVINFTFLSFLCLHILCCESSIIEVHTV